MTRTGRTLLLPSRQGAAANSPDPSPHHRMVGRLWPKVILSWSKFTRSRDQARRSVRQVRCAPRRGHRDPGRVGRGRNLQSPSAVSRTRASPRATRPPFALWGRDHAGEGRSSGPGSGPDRSRYEPLPLCASLVGTHLSPATNKKRSQAAYRGDHRAWRQGGTRRRAAWLARLCPLGRA